MITSDLHTHTWFSDDCKVPFTTCIESAIAQGIETLAITDHYDPGYPNPDFPFVINFEKYLPALTEAKEKYANQIQILAGIEVGIKRGEFDVSVETVHNYDYDVVLGSFHCYEDIDIAVYDYDEYPSSREQFLEDFYIYMLDCLKAYDDYDVLGHFSVMDRYIGGLYDYAPFEDVIDEILKLIIAQDKAMEINTSNFRYQMGTWLPRESILRRYYELGGRLITFGSDAHHPKFYREYFEEAADLARSIGFTHHCIYEKRQPKLISL